MLGHFGIIIRNNTIQNTAQITQEIQPGQKYMVSFLNEPPFMRICDIEEIQGWLLFPNKESGEKWIAGNAQQQMPMDPPVAPPAGNGQDIPPSDTEGDDAGKQQEADMRAEQNRQQGGNDAA